MNNEQASDDRITRDEFDVWEKNPITQLIKKNLHVDISTILELLLNNSPIQTGQNQLLIEGEYKGRINCAKEIISIDYEQIKKLLEQE